MEHQNRYLTENQVAEITGRAVQTLRNDRFLGKGFPYSKIGRSVRYSLNDIHDFMKSRAVKTSGI
ncbi:MAG: helix-turn-helix domain-containing protein [Desulfobacterales bacterium]|jgi:predicted DNA-binding transcriptional regulator AlpA|nr:helix-turn-helix domain-containing protein [Desulfobacterales bacterium]